MTLPTCRSIFRQWRLFYSTPRFLIPTNHGLSRSASQEKQYILAKRRQCTSFRLDWSETMRMHFRGQRFRSWVAVSLSEVARSDSSKLTYR